MHGRDVILRVIDHYRPNAILLSSGFDAHRRDPLGGMHVTEQAYGEITRRIVEAAARYSSGRVLSLLEGGYDMEGLSASVAEHVNALLHESIRALSAGSRVPHRDSNDGENHGAPRDSKFHLARGA